MGLTGGTEEENRAAQPQSVPEPTQGIHMSPEFTETERLSDLRFTG